VGGFYPGSHLRDHRHGIAASFEAARATFETAWRDYLPRHSEADFQECRDHLAWVPEKRRRLDRCKQMPNDWRPGT